MLDQTQCSEKGIEIVLDLMGFLQTLHKVETGSIKISPAVRKKLQQQSDRNRLKLEEFRKIRKMHDAANKVDDYAK